MLYANGNKISEVICLACFHRWISIRPMETRLNDLECPTCGKQGYAIETGEIGVTEDLLMKVSEGGEKHAEFRSVKELP